ncbi:MAG: LacI family DNA-binding transcriptional regulator [Opitutaceae bacterium]
MGAQVPSPVPLRVIAEQANVSRMTVSLALRDDPSLSEATRVRIRELAKKLGYRPDPDVARLMERIREKRTRHLPNLIAYLTAYEKPWGWKNEPTQRLYFEGAQRRALECGYELSEFWLREPGMTDKRLSDIIRNRGIDGALVAPLPHPEPLFQHFRWSHVAAVELGYSLRQPALHRSCNHQFQSMLLLMEKLMELGYRRPGLAVAADQDDRVNHHWRAAFFTGQSLWWPGREAAPLLARDWKLETFRGWILDQRPDVVITVGEEAAAWLRELDIRVPGDIGMANVDLRPHMTGTTGIDQNSEMVGAAAVDHLLSLLHHNERGIPSVPRIIMVEGRWVAGKTTRRIKS